MVKNLKPLRNLLGISQQTLANELGISQQSVNRYENHSVEPDIALLIAMADFFGVSVDYLIGRPGCDSNNKTELNSERILSKFKQLNHQEQEYAEAILDVFLKNK